MPLTILAVATCTWMDAIQENCRNLVAMLSRGGA